LLWYGRNYKVQCWGNLQWHNVHTKFYENQSLGLKATGRHRQHRHLFSYLEKGK